MKNPLIALVIVLVAALPAFAADRRPSPAGDITIAAVGDLMLGGRTEPFLDKYGPDYPYRNVIGILRSADVVAGNLESPISARGTAVENKKFTLRAGAVAARSLKSAGIRVVSLANNHAMDFGPLALEDTLAALADSGVLYTGAGMDLADARTPAVIKVKGNTLAFLSYSLTFPLEFFASPSQAGTAPGYAEFIRADIKKARRRADLVIVSFHWGAELMTSAKDYQVELGRRAIDWGADLVLGHHPHVLQDLEVYKGRLIAYSLGNFVFGSESNRTNWSMILLLTFRNKRLIKAEAVPIDVNNYRVKYQPRVLSGKQARDVLESVNAASARFNTSLEIAGGRGTLVLSAAGREQTRPDQDSRPSATVAGSGAGQRASRPE